jgi:Protein of unknown function DUF262
MEKASIDPGIEEIEEIDEIDEIDEKEQEPLEFWEQKQRELVTSVVDYNLSTLIDLINGKNIDLSPVYQRRNRWDDDRKSALIESFLINVPVPPVFLNEDNYGEYSIIDGKQRLTAIHDFLTGSLRLKNMKVFSELNDKKFHELPAKLQSVIKTRPTLRAVIILRQSDSDIKFEVFRRLNTGGVALNAQEVRNSVNTGKFNNLLLTLSQDKNLHRLLGIKKREESKIYREMFDVELVLRYFTFRDSWMEFDGGVVRHLDEFMKDNRYMEDDKIQAARSDFLHTLSVVDALWGERAFRRWNPQTAKWRDQILSSLFEAQMIACRGIDLQKTKGKRDEALKLFQQLFEEEQFQKAIKASIPIYFKLRIERVKSIVNRVIGQSDQY